MGATTYGAWCGKGTDLAQDDVELEEETHVLRLLRTYEQSLAHYKYQAAQTTPNTPFHVVSAIQECEKEIAKIKASEAYIRAMARVESEAEPEAELTGEFIIKEHNRESARIAFSMKILGFGAEQLLGQLINVLSSRHLNIDNVQVQSAVSRRRKKRITAQV